MMINKKVHTYTKLAIKSALNKATANQISCKGLLNNWILGEVRG